MTILSGECFTVEVTAQKKSGGWKPSRRGVVELGWMQITRPHNSSLDSLARPLHPGRSRSGSQGASQTIIGNPLFSWQTRSPSQFMPAQHC